MSEVHCKECGSLISDKTSSCPNCGNKIEVDDYMDPNEALILARSNRLEKHCPECGGVVKDSDSKCSYCGYPLSNFNSKSVGISSGQKGRANFNKKHIGVAIGIILIVGIVSLFGINSHNKNELLANMEGDWIGPRPDDIRSLEVLDGKVMYYLKASRFYDEKELYNSEIKIFDGKTFGLPDRSDEKYKITFSDDGNTMMISPSIVSSEDMDVWEKDDPLTEKGVDELEVQVDFVEWMGDSLVLKGKVTNNGESSYKNIKLKYYVLDERELRLGEQVGVVDNASKWLEPGQSTTFMKKISKEEIDDVEDAENCSAQLECYMKK